MAKTCREMGILCILVVFMLVNLGSSDLTKDKEECANQLAGLATCLPYVGGEAKAPTLDCCTGLKQVLKESKKCVCILVKDRNDPSLGLKINATLALSLPQTCHAPSSANVSDCLALLHLSPNSPDAKVFNDFANAAAPAASTSPASTAKSTGSSSGTSAKDTSDGGKGTGRLVAHMICGVLLWCLTSHLIF